VLAPFCTDSVEGETVKEKLKANDVVEATVVEETVDVAAVTVNVICACCVPARRVIV